jgi:hypothetical protein
LDHHEVASDDEQELLEAEIGERGDVPSLERTHGPGLLLNVPRAELHDVMT